jgi:hypothetical protein
LASICTCTTGLFRSETRVGRGRQGLLLEDDAAVRVQSGRAFVSRALWAAKLVASDGRMNVANERPSVESDEETFIDEHGRSLHLVGADVLHQWLRLLDVACASSTCSAAAIAASMIVVVSPSSAPCTVTATIAPVSTSTACSALRELRAAVFHLATFASGSAGLVQSLFEVFFFRLRSSRAKASRVGVLMPDASASRVRNAW